MNPLEAKKRLREELRGRVGAMSAVERAAASARIREHLTESDAWERASVVLMYAADASEPDLDGLIGLGTEAGKTVCVPGLDWAAKTMAPAAVRGVEDLVDDRHGIRVPAPTCPAVAPESVGLVVVPGVGFDRAGGRVGRGGGFYDRFLAGLEAGGPIGTVVLGACFAAQVVGRVPSGPHDRRVDGLVTETGLTVVVRDTEGPG